MRNRVASRVITRIWRRRTKQRAQRLRISRDNDDVGGDGGEERNVMEYWTASSETMRTKQSA